MKYIRQMEGVFKSASQEIELIKWITNKLLKSKSSSVIMLSIFLIISVDVLFPSPRFLTIA